MVLGALVIVVIGVLVANYFRSQEEGVIPGGATERSFEPGSVYTVVLGDTLWSIAEMHYDSGYNWVDIAIANSLTDPSLVEVGDELSIPEVELKLATVEVPTETPTEMEAKPPAETPESIAGATYTVAKGDNLWDIAVRAYGDGYRWVNIAAENELLMPGVIHAGNELSLPR